MTVMEFYLRHKFGEIFLMWCIFYVHELLETELLRVQKSEIVVESSAFQRDGCREKTEGCISFSIHRLKNRMMIKTCWNNNHFFAFFSHFFQQKFHCFL